MLEGLLVALFILERLAHGEVEVNARFFAEILARELDAHGFLFVRAEAKGLQVREAPVGLSRGRRDALSIGCRAVRLAAGGRQSVAVAQPDPGVLGMDGENLLVQLDRLLVLADRENHGSGILVRCIARIGLLQPIDLRKRRRRLVLSLQHDGVLVARRCEARRQFQARLEECLGIRVASQACRDLRQHPNRSDIGGILLEMRSEQCLRLCDSALDVLRVRLVGAGRITAHRQVVANGAPGIRHLRLRRTAWCSDSRAAAAQFGCAFVRASRTLAAPSASPVMRRALPSKSVATG